MRRFFILIFLLLLVSCGSDLPGFDPSVVTQVSPYVVRVAPVAATEGDVVTVFGIGFSDVPDLNVIIINGTEILGETYGLAIPPSGAEFEYITFTVPAGLTLGAQNIYVDVFTNISNTNVTLTVN